MSRVAWKTRGSKGGEKDEDSSPAWVNGIRCVLDIALNPPSFEPPLRVPAALYLEEVSLGMVGGAGDPSSQTQAPAAQRKPGMAVTPQHRMQGLLRLLSGDAAGTACQSLFWLVLAGVFQMVPAEALPGLRAELGQSWYGLTLHALADVPGDRQVQDWLLGALPFVFAQAIYRLLVDGFVEDRKHFVKEADSLLLKASLVAHFEVTGFQATAETVRRARRSLFLRRVVKCAHIDQREFMRGKKRQEILESHSAGASDQPLEFGKMSSQALEESQLDQVMHGSETRRRQNEKALASGKAPWLLETFPVPAELSVERYGALSGAGLELLDRHLAELAACLGHEAKRIDQEEEEEEHLVAPTPFTCSPVSEPSSPLGLSPPGSPHRSRAATGSGKADARDPFGLGSAGGEAAEEGGPKSPTRTRRLWRKSMAIARLNLAGEERRTRKERESKARKLRQETLQRKIAVEPLPQELAQRTLETTWVSPAMMSLAGAPDRQLLRKTSAEAFRLKMAVRPMPTRPLSMPALRSAAKAHGQQSPPTRRRVPVDVSTVAGGSQHSPDRGGGGREESVAGSVRASTGLGRGEADSSRQGPLSAVAAAGANLPRMGAAAFPGSGKAVAARGGEVISLEPPPRLSGKLIAQRLEAQEKAFQKQSFAIYMKEHDIFTGHRKVCYDQKRLADEEDAYVKKMGLLVGGEPKYLIPPESMLARQYISAGKA